MNKKLLAFSVIGFFALALVSAGIISYYGQVQQNVTVEQAITFEGENMLDAIIVGGESVTSNDLLVSSDTSVNVPLSIDTTPVEEGVVHVVNYLLDNSDGTCANYPAEGWRDECEKRLDFEGMALSDFNSMSWDVDVVEGYVSHVDLILDNGESLTIEYATFDSDCNAPSSYPEGEYVFSIDSDTYAWESIPGACGVPAFDEQHNTLTEWKATYPTATITRIEIEVDNWIEASNSIISNVVINGEDVSDEPTLLVGGELEFNVETTFGLLNEGEYTITTEVIPRV